MPYGMLHCSGILDLHHHPVCFADELSSACTLGSHRVKFWMDKPHPYYCKLHRLVQGH